MPLRFGSTLTSFVIAGPMGPTIIMFVPAGESSIIHCFAESVVVVIVVVVGGAVLVVVVVVAVAVVVVDDAFLLHLTEDV